MKSTLTSIALAACLGMSVDLLPMAFAGAEAALAETDVRSQETPENASRTKTGYSGHFAGSEFSGTSRALCAAVSDGHFAEASRLVQSGADLEARSTQPLTEGMTILQLAVWHRWDVEAVKLLLDLGADVESRDRRGNSALIYEAEARPAIRSAVVRLLLDAGADVNAHGQNGMTALMHAAMHDDPTAVALLLGAGADVHAADKAGWTALMHATRRNRGHEGVVILLIAAGSDVNAVHRRGGTAIGSAAYNGHTRVVELLVEARANVNVRDEAGWTPLICASTRGHLQVVERLLAAGADVSARDLLGRTALSAAASGRHASVVKRLAPARRKLTP
ncbi:MAG: ankyrin repeat domain-containing protein [Planctomycetes bacterium]|nr:ankyrin repeat domain-containing protein [Planctomycetota bacterium]